jgi:transposase-like protein
MAVVVATGIAADGSREILGLDVGDSEDEVFWRGFLITLKQRGLGGIQLVISDQHAGLVKALAVASRALDINAAGSTSPATCWPTPPLGHQ